MVGSILIDKYDKIKRLGHTTYAPLGSSSVAVKRISSPPEADADQPCSFERLACGVPHSPGFASRERDEVTLTARRTGECKPTSLTYLDAT